MNNNRHTLLQHNVYMINNNDNNLDILNGKKSNPNSKIQSQMIDNTNCKVNNKRKISPSVTIELQKKTKNEINKKIEKIKCPKCKKSQDSEDRFCNACGSRLKNETKNLELMKEIEFMQKMNHQLESFIQMRMCSKEIWYAMKLIFPKNGVICYPMESFIIEANKEFNHLLGYEDMNNVYYPDLFPKNHIVELTQKNFFIKVERNSKITNPKMIYEHDVYLRHSRGHFIHVASSGTFYFDTHTRMPSVKMIYIKKILNEHVLEDQLPPKHSHPTTIKFCTDNFNELPDFIKKFCHKPFENDQIQDQDTISNQDLLQLMYNDDIIHHNQIPIEMNDHILHNLIPANSIIPQDLFVDSLSTKPNTFGFLPSHPSPSNLSSNSMIFGNDNYIFDPDSDCLNNNEDIFNFF